MSEAIKPKQKYKFSKKINSPKRLGLDVNLRGFLCSCNFREKDCVRESYNLLNKYTEKLYGDQSKTSSGSAGGGDDEADEIDIEDSLSKEVAALKDKTKFKQFQALESGAKNVLFIRTTLDNPVELAQKIVEDINETRIQQTRYLIRLVPIEVTCKAYVDDIVKAFEPLAEKYFIEKPLSFSVVYNHRNNNHLFKEEVIKKIANKVFSLRSDHKVDLKNADISVVVEVIKGFALLGVVPNYIKYKKYNLLMISEQESNTDVENAADSKVSE